jgi:hypothetical protein
MYSRIQDENFWDLDPGLGMKTLGIWNEKFRDLDLGSASEIQHP